MKFKPVNALEHSLMRAVQDPSWRPQFYRDFVASEIFAIHTGPQPIRTGNVVLQPNQQLSVAMFEGHDGKMFIPIFSSLPRLQAVVPQDASYIAMDAMEFLKMTGGRDLFLNPGSEFGKEFPATEIAAIVDGSMLKLSSPVNVDEPRMIRMGQPARNPAEFVAALTRLFARKKEITRAWLALVSDPGRAEKPHTMIGIETAIQLDTIASEIGTISLSTPVFDPPVEVMQITPGGPVDLFSTIKPFYKRKGFGIF